MSPAYPGPTFCNQPESALPPSGIDARGLYPGAIPEGATSAMPTYFESPTRIEAAGTKPKRIDEFVGRVNSGTPEISIAHMRSPGGWCEPFQVPEFHEYTLVLNGTLRVEHDGGTIDVCAGQAIATRPGERVRYSTPGKDGAEYVAVCTPAFSPDTVRREE